VCFITILVGIGRFCLTLIECSGSIISHIYIYEHTHENIHGFGDFSYIYIYIYIYICVASEECFHIDRMSGLNDFTYMYINIQGFGDFTYIYIYLCIIFTLIKCSGSMISHIYV